MVDSDNRLPAVNVNIFSDIEEIIDERKRLGQYNVYKQPNAVNIRCVYSSPTGSTEHSRSVKFDEASMVSNNEGCSSYPCIKHTDSEITIVRVKCNDELLKRKLNQWDILNDIAIPGDGSHLGESPSLVNLATLVAQNIQCEGDEYLVPLSSWDPYLKNEDQTNIKCCSDTKVNEILERNTVKNTLTDPNININTENDKLNDMEADEDVKNEDILVFRRPSWAGKFSKFIRKHCRKSKALPDISHQDDTNRRKKTMEISTPPYIEVKAIPKVESTATETLLVILPSFCYTLLAVFNTSLLRNVVKNTSVLFLLEFCVIVIPIILNVTITTEYIREILITLNVFIIIYYYLLLYLVFKMRVSTSKHIQKTALQKGYITNARSVINLISVIAILAVDFKVFPRKFAKTDTYGFSLMDVGVGLYVFANGIISPEVRGHRDSIRKTLKGSIILLTLGIGRLIATSLVNYNVPITEYGRHWNFFITLAFTRIFTSFFLNVISIKYIFINAFALIISHEVFLQAGLNEYIYYRLRDNLVAANKEGIVSLAGFVSIYLFSVYVGYFICYKSNESKRKTNLKFALFSAIFLILTYLFQVNFGISRRLANAAYCSWVMFIGVFMTWLFYICENINEVIIRPKLPNCVLAPYIFEAINYNGLVFFLVGNLLTGLINLTLDTMKARNLIGLCIITVYMFVNCVVVFVLYRKQIKLKL